MDEDEMTCDSRHREQGNERDDNEEFKCERDGVVGNILEQLIRQSRTEVSVLTSEKGPSIDFMS